MAQLIQVIKKFDDGTETVHDFVPNPDASEIEAKVAEAMIPPIESEVTASESLSLVDDSTLSSTEDVEETPKKKEEGE